MNKIIGSIAVIALIVGGWGLYNTFQTQPVQQNFGATAGGDFFNLVSFHAGVVTGGNDFATSSQGTVTYTTASIVKANLIEHIATAATTATLPTNTALSAAGFLPNPGDTVTIYLHASTTAITIAGNTGVTLYSASSTKQVAEGAYGSLECTRLGKTEARLIECLLTAD